MNDADRRLLRDRADQLSPTLDENYNLVEALPRVPICVACQMAQWYKLEAVPPKSETSLAPDPDPKPPTLECFCTVFRGTVYDGRRVITACDAYEDALNKSERADAACG